MKQLLAKLMVNPVARRLISGFGANLIGKLWVSLIQFLSVPVLTLAWGVDGFGIWLMIITIPSYLALSDFGLSTAAGNDVTQAVAKGDRIEALRSFQTSWVFSTVISLTVAMLVAIALVLWPTPDAIISATSGKNSILWAIGFTLLGTMFSLQMGMLQIMYQATHKYALGATLRDLNIPLQGFAIIIVASLGGGLAEAAAAAACVAGVIMILYFVILVRLEPWVKLGTAHFDVTTLKRLLHPSLAAFALMAANSFGIHAVVIMVGWTMGPAAAAIFATARMLSRTPLQISGLLTRASISELIHAQSAKNAKLENRLASANLAIALMVMLPSFIVVSIWGPWMLDALSHGKMESGNLLFMLLAVAATLNAIWTAQSARLLAANRQGEYAWVVFGLSLLVAISPMFWVDLAIVAGAMVVAEGMVVGQVIRKQTKL